MTDLLTLRMDIQKERIDNLVEWVKSLEAKVKLLEAEIIPLLEKKLTQQEIEQ